MTEFFEELIEKLGIHVGVPLHLDNKGVCLLVYKEKLKVQIQNYPERERVGIGSFLGEIPPGKFRENVFKEALKANGIFPSQGSFSYILRNRNLAIWRELPYYELTPDQFSKTIFQFIEKADLWRSCLESGSLLPVAQQVTSKLPGPMMGLR
jgi:hypothetical protein